MSIIVAKGEQITRCANNTSTSNQMYTFGKGNRDSYHKKSVCNSLYNIPSSFSSSIKENKGFSLGFGNKLFTKKIKKETEPKTYYYEECSLISKRKGNCSTFGKPTNRSNATSRLSTNVTLGGSNSKTIISK